jgi:predicted ATPase/class 3 adenylate cyclase
MQCPSCAADTAEGSRFCNCCGVALPPRCGECGHSNTAGSKFCANCGARLTGQGSAPPAERRQVTVMFCDLVGSTALSAGLDPEDLRAVIATYYREVASEVQRFGGIVARHVSDGVMAYFGYPLAHEDDSERAARAGLALIGAIDRLELRPGIRLQARVGIATGLVVVDMIGEGPAQAWTVLGDAPNLAARLQTVAEPGTVLLAPATHHLIGDLFECRALGPRQVKGLAEPIETWQLLRPHNVATRFLARRAARTPIVGRAEELELLLRRWEQAKTGEGRVVLISGEPGIGKSRLMRALEERIGEEPHVRVSYFGSALHQDSALFPVIEQLERAAGIGREDNAGMRLDKLAALFEPYSADLQEDVALFAQLLGIDGGKRYPPPDLSPRVRMQRTLATLSSLLVGLSSRHPVLVTFEDVHWIDPSTYESLLQTVERLQTLPVLLVVTARPEFQPPCIGLPHVTLQTLNRLDRRDRVELIGHLTGGKPLPDQVLQQIVERTDGVPLFVEELTRAVVESGYLREGAGGYVFHGPLPELALPATLQGSLLARLDRLNGAREIAQEAAAIGREFSYDLIAAVTTRGEPELAKGLDQLVASGLVQQRGAPPAATYSFRHALMQDAAYSTLLRSRREALHARIARVYEQQFRDLVEARPELMAHHLAQAGFAERSVGFWLEAARITIARGGAAEAIAQLQRGLALLNEIPDRDTRRRLELELQITLGNALAAATGYAGTATDAAFRRARELCLEVGDTAQLIRATWGQFTGYFAGGRQRPAFAAATELLALSERCGDAGGRQMGHASVGASLFHLASFAAARPQFEAALAIDAAPERERTHLYGQSGRVTALVYMSLDLLVLGLLDSAQRLAEQAVEEACTLGHPTSLCFAHSILCRLSYLLGDKNALAQHTAMVVRLADEHGLGLWRALGRIYLGWSCADGGALDEAAALIRDGIAKYRAIGAALSLPLYLASLANIEGASGNRREALALLHQAQAASMAGDEYWMSAEIHRLVGKTILAGSGDAAAAEREFQAALALSREQGARLWELRAATSLAGLWRDGNTDSRARDGLAGVYRSFSEGFTATDLEQARSMLGTAPI